MALLTDKFDIVIDGQHYSDPAEVPAKFEALVRGAIADAATRRASELAELGPGERLPLELTSNFSVAADFSITWNGQRYERYAALPDAAKDALVGSPVFPDLDDDGVPDFFQHPTSDDIDEQRQIFRAAMRQNRDAQAIAASRVERFAPDYPGYELATFEVTVGGATYPSLDEVPAAKRETAQRLVVEFLRRRRENEGGPLTDGVIRLSDSALPGRTARPVEAPVAEEPPVHLPEDLAGKIHEITTRQAAVAAGIARSPIVETSSNRAAVIVMAVAASVAIALLVVAFVVAGSL